MRITILPRNTETALSRAGLNGVLLNFFSEDNNDKTKCMLILSMSCWNYISKSTPKAIFEIGCLPKCINTKFVVSSTTVYKLCRYVKLPNNASTINPMPDYFLTAFKIDIDDVYNRIHCIYFAQRHYDTRYFVQTQSN